VDRMKGSPALVEASQPDETGTRRRTDCGAATLGTPQWVSRTAALTCAWLLIPS
jgi:hypothetical protein